MPCTQGVLSPLRSESGKAERPWADSCWLFRPMPVRVCQNEIMDEKTLPVVPSSWEEGLGVVEKNNDITYYKLNI